MYTIGLIIVLALGIIIGLLITFVIELFARKPHERNQPLAKLIPKQKGVILEQSPLINSFMNFDNDYDPSRDTEVESL